MNTFQIIPSGGSSWFVECQDDNGQWQRAGVINWPGDHGRYCAHCCDGGASEEFAERDEAVRFLVRVFGEEQSTPTIHTGTPPTERS